MKRNNPEDVTNVTESENNIPIHFTLYLDESGDHLLYSEEEYLTNSDLETHCTLTGVIIPNDQKHILKEQLAELKKYFWNIDSVILHSVEIRHKQGAFAIFHYKPELYDEFKVKIIEVFKQASPTIICSSLNKRTWIAMYPRKYYFKDDPYEQAFVFLLERYARFLNEQGSKNVVGKISVEKRNPKKDKALLQTYKRVIENGTQYKTKDYFRKLSDKLDFDEKNYNIPGLQLSDYCSYPFYINHRFPARTNELYQILRSHIFFHKKWPT